MACDSPRSRGGCAPHAVHAEHHKNTPSRQEHFRERRAGRSPVWATRSRSNQRKSVELVETRCGRCQGGSPGLYGRDERFSAGGRFVKMCASAKLSTPRESSAVKPGSPKRALFAFWGEKARQRISPA